MQLSSRLRVGFGYTNAASQSSSHSDTRVVRSEAKQEQLLFSQLLFVIFYTYIYKMNIISTNTLHEQAGHQIQLVSS